MRPGPLFVSVGPTSGDGHDSAGGAVRRRGGRVARTMISCGGRLAMLSVLRTSPEEADRTQAVIPIFRSMRGSRPDPATRRRTRVRGPLQLRPAGTDPHRVLGPGERRRPAAFRPGHRARQARRRRGSGVGRRVPGIRRRLVHHRDRTRRRRRLVRHEGVQVKITSSRTHRVAPLWCFLRIDTDQGITGWGEPVVEGRAHGRREGRRTGRGTGPSLAQSRLAPGGRFLRRVVTHPSS